MSKMRALALVIGNADYNLKQHKLVNSVNDARDLSAALANLGFVVRNYTDTNRESFERNAIAFANELKSYDVGLFYFSGHGLQIEGMNYLTCTDTNFIDDTSAKYTSYPLDAMIEYMKKAKTKINILILDACRDNPYLNNYRGIGASGLAPIHAPKGTLIAFSTSPGEKAKDFGSGRNSYYTGALLNHINDPNIPIEDFFKRVRTSVFTLSNGAQTSWEHTSLIGSFYFNSGQLIHSTELPYKDDYIADSDFQSSGSEVDKIIESLRSHDWYKQNAAIEKFQRMSPQVFDESSLFLIGRNILQAAQGGARQAQHIIDYLDTWASKYSIDGNNHVLNGILFEIYFDSKGLFRKNDFKSKLIDQVFKIQINKSFNPSFDFIQKQLAPFSDYIFYLPGHNAKSCAIELTGEVFQYKSNGSDHQGLQVKSVKHVEIELINNDINDENLDWIRVSQEQFKETLSQQLCVPKNKLTISSNEDLKKYFAFTIPWNLKLSRIRLETSRIRDEL